MIERAFIDVAGPPGSGKTAFIESLLAGARGPILVARCVRDDTVTRAQEAAPRSHPELRRYRQAGATGAVVFTFPGHAVRSDDFFMTNLMMNYSHAVVLEGDNPLEFSDLRVFVVSAPAEGEELFVRRPTMADEGAGGAILAQLLSEPDGMADVLNRIGGARLAELGSRSPEFLDKVSAKLRDAGAGLRSGSAPRRAERWTIADGYAGIEHAHLVVVNARHGGDRRVGEALVADMRRLRKDDELSADILGARGNRIPITAVVADLADPDDPERKKALARTHRTIRARS